MLGELNGQQIEDVLHADVTGRIGCQVDGRTDIVPIMYADDGEYLYGQTAAGMKAQLRRANPSACLEVEHVDDLASWRSAIAWGSFDELQGGTTAAGMRTLLDTLTPLMANSTAQPGHGLGLERVPPGAHRADTAGKEAILSLQTPGREDRAFREALRRLSGRMPGKRTKRR